MQRASSSDKVGCFGFGMEKLYSKRNRNPKLAMINLSRRRGMGGTGRGRGRQQNTNNARSLTDRQTALTTITDATWTALIGAERGSVQGQSVSQKSVGGRSVGRNQQGPSWEGVSLAGNAANAANADGKQGASHPVPAPCLPCPATLSL